MLADAFEPPDEIPELRPKPFCGVHMDFPDAVIIVIPCPFLGTVANSGMVHVPTPDLVVGMAFIGVTAALQGAVCRQCPADFLLVDRPEDL